MAKKAESASAEKSTQNKAEKKTAVKKKAKKKTDVVKKPRKTAAQAVRDFMETHPHLRNRDIVKALAEAGIVIDDTIPAQIKSRDKNKRKKAEKADRETSTAAEKTTKSKKPAKKSSATARSAAIKQPTVFVHSPVHEEFAKDLLSVRTHSQAIKNMRIHVAKLERIIEMMEALKDDDWELTLLAQPDGLFFSAVHQQAHDVAQVRARLEKLGFLPNEVVIVDAVK